MANTTDTAVIDINRTTQASDSLVYRVATIADCDSLAAIVNSSYRGEVSHQGWTHEDELISGPRTNADILINMIDTGKHTLLVFFGENDQVLKGCICLSHELESKTAHLGIFVVRPDLQTRGYGKFILSVTENYTISHWNIDCIELSVRVQRPELIAYYNRRGFTDTDRRQPFPVQSLKYERVKREDLEFCIMSKSVTTI